MIETFIILLCILLNGLLAGAEAAFIAVNKTHLRELAKQGKRHAKTLLYLRDHPEKTLSVIQLGITFVGALAAGVGGAGAEESLAPWMEKALGLGERSAEFFAIMIVVAAITYISVLIGELVPKTLGLRRPLFVSLKAAPWLQMMSLFAYPIVWILEKSTKGIIGLFPQRHRLEESVPEGETVLSMPNRQYVLNLVKLERTTARDILIPWKEVVTLESTFEMEKASNLLLSSGHTRVPVLKNNEIVGIVNYKEFIAFQKTGGTEWLSLVRPLLSIEETIPVLAVFRLMQTKHMPMAVAYKDNKALGIVTMKDIIEEIMGDIYDENDDGAIQRILSRRLK